MCSRTPISDALRKMMAEVNADTGRTNRDTIVEVLETKAAGGDAEAGRLLKWAKSIQEAKSGYAGSGRAVNDE